MSLLKRSISVLSLTIGVFSLAIHGKDTQSFLNCVNNINVADADKSETLNRTEYLKFHRSVCNISLASTVKAMTTSDLDSFYALACLCRFKYDANANCCDGNSAAVDVPNVQTILNGTNELQEVDDKLNSVCAVASSTCDELNRPTRSPTETYRPTATPKTQFAPSPTKAGLFFTPSPTSISVYDPKHNPDPQGKKPSSGTDADPSAITTGVTSQTSGSLRESHVFRFGLLSMGPFVALML